MIRFVEQLHVAMQIGAVRQLASSRRFALPHHRNNHRLGPEYSAQLAALELSALRELVCPSGRMGMRLAKEQPHSDHLGQGDTSCKSPLQKGTSLLEQTNLMMPAMNTQEPSRFSLLYLERGQPTRDSTRFRNRLAAFFEQHIDNAFGYEVKRLYEMETGAKVPWHGMTWVFADVFRKAELRDVFDAITMVFRAALAKQDRRSASAWLGFVERAMREENVGNTVDGQCIVHYHVDQEFERNRAATVAALERPELAAVRAAFEDAYRHLDSDPRDTKAAVRSMFEALEILSRSLVPEAKNLNRWLVKNTLRQKCLAVAAADAIEQKVTSGLFDGMAEWVEAIHNYRHGQAEQEPVAPSEDLAVHILSTGSAYLRQLAIFAQRTDKCLLGNFSVT